MSATFKELIGSLQNSENFKDYTWTGSFDDYLALVRENPKITRNAYQRMYDMIMSKGSNEYVDVKKQMVHYKFFDDPDNDGKDAVFGADIPLMKLVNVLRSAALGYGTEKRVILLHGPVGSAKSTICRLLKQGLERYSKADEGAIYTFDWVDEAGDCEEIFGKGVKVFPSPMHEEPLLLIPEQLRQGV
ncbi:MAG TPA: serine protein kinase, partial [Bdellovibrionales bacterium]|nr:serine protein kinase [Bdellovibrionales bacterium]